MTSLEKWRQVSDWPYEVSNLGRVRRIGRSSGPTPAGGVLRQQIKRGYPAVHLRDAPREAWPHVHRLVAEAFLGSPPTAEHQVHHRDHGTANNRADNLEWVTCVENQRYRRDNGTDNTGEMNGRAKLSEEDVRHLRCVYEKGGISQQELADRYGVSQPVISAAVRGETWSHIPLPDDL